MQSTLNAIAYSRDEAKITIVGVEDRPGVAVGIFGPLSDSGINVDMIVQNISVESGRTDITFTVGQSDFDRASALLDEIGKTINYRSIDLDDNVVKISVIGVGMRSHAGVAKQMFGALAGKGINIQVISTSEIKISILIADEYAELALRALHTEYGLDLD